MFAVKRKHLQERIRSILYNIISIQLIVPIISLTSSQAPIYIQTNWVKNV